MVTKEIIEALLHKIPSIRKPLYSIGVISNKRMISSVERKEFDNILKDFTEKSRIISIYSTMQTVAIIQKIENLSKFKIIFIRGAYTEIVTLSKSGLTSELLESLFIKEYLPPAFQNKIVYIDEYNENENRGIVFSEYLNNEWTTEDGMKLGDIASVKNYSVKVILTNIVNGIMESQIKEEEEESLNDV